MSHSGGRGGSPGRDIERGKPLFRRKMEIDPHPDDSGHRGLADSMEILSFLLSDSRPISEFKIINTHTYIHTYIHANVWI